MASFRESPVSSSAIISLIERGSKLAQPSAKIVNFFPSMSISGKDGPVDSSMLSDSVPVCASVVSFVFPLSFPQEAMRFPAISIARRSDMSLAFLMPEYLSLLFICQYRFVGAISETVVSPNTAPSDIAYTFTAVSGFDG